MNTTQQPEALNLEEFRAKVTHAAREPLLARIAELEASESRTITQRDHCEEVIDRMADAVLGKDRHEWTSNYDYMDAAQEVEDRIAELEAQLSAIGAGGVEPLRKREAAPQAAVPETREALGKRLIADVKVANAIAAVACQRVAELPDRDSPADWPEAMLVTGDELHMIVREAAIEAQAAPAHPAEGVPAHETCETCQGNGEIVKDWDRYKHPHVGDKGDEAVSPCQDCEGTGEITPAHPAGGVPAQVVELEVDDLIDRLLNAQQDLNLAANVHMDQSIASASTLLDEVEIALRALAATPAADAGNPVSESDVPVVLPDPEGWLATFRPKGMLSSHSIAGANLEELKRSVPSDSVFKPLYTNPTQQGRATGGQAQAVAMLATGLPELTEEALAEKIRSHGAYGGLAAHLIPFIAQHAAPHAQADARDAARYRWLRNQMLGVDFDWCGNGITALVFEVPDGCAYSSNCDQNIDAAIAAQAKQGGV